MSLLHFLLEIAFASLILGGVVHLFRRSLDPRNQSSNSRGTESPRKIEPEYKWVWCTWCGGRGKVFNSRCMPCNGGGKIRQRVR
jgi:hypothetical protein